MTPQQLVRLAIALMIVGALVLIASKLSNKALGQVRV